MTIEEAEEVFGKRWNHWTDDEWDEFLQVVTLESVMLPLILKKLYLHYKAGRLSECRPEVRNEFVNILMPKHRLN